MSSFSLLFIEWTSHTSVYGSMWAFSSLSYEHAREQDDKSLRNELNVDNT